MAPKANPSTPQTPKTPHHRPGTQPASAKRDSAKKKPATAAKKNRKGAEKIKEAGVEQDPVDWDKDNFRLSMSLMTAITDDKVIEDALFPKVGPNPSTKSGGGKPKTDHYWELCKVLFTDHPDHGTAFTVALDGGKKERGPWTMKIKNRLTRMVGIVNKGHKLLGQTGEGIRQEEEITDDLPEAFRNKWEELKAKCPYYFQLLELIAEHPNHVPTSLGNSDTPVQEGVIFGDDHNMGNGNRSDGEADNEGDNRDLEEAEVDEPEESGAEGRDTRDGDGAESEGGGEGGSEGCSSEAGESDSPIEVHAGQKRKAKTTASKLKTPARAGTSTPASTTKGKAKKFKGAAVFEELTKTKEKTRQMELKVKVQKLLYNTKKVKAKLEREKTKMEREKNKLEVICMKYELCMECVKAHQQRSKTPPTIHHTNSSFNLPTSIPSSSGHASGSQTPIMFSQDMYSLGELAMGDNTQNCM